jgi:hypothetical protein
MEKKISNKALAEPLFQLYDEEEDIELENLEIETDSSAPKKNTFQE